VVISIEDDEVLHGHKYLIIFLFREFEHIILAYI